MHFDQMWEWHWVMWIFMVIFWVLVVLGAIALFKRITESKKELTGESPLDILKKRYAKGEISEEEFKRMKEQIIEERRE